MILELTSAYTFMPSAWAQRRVEAANHDAAPASFANYSAPVASKVWENYCLPGRNRQYDFRVVEFGQRLCPKHAERQRGKETDKETERERQTNRERHADPHYFPPQLLGRACLDNSICKNSHGELGTDRFFQRATVA